MQNLEKSMISKLIETAMEQLKFSYTPYSNFKVGASLLTKNGQIYTGCNIENAAYTPTNCAERTAIFKAVSEGVREFDTICIVGGKDGILTEYTAPCGVCRQVMMEFCDPETFRIIPSAGKAARILAHLAGSVPFQSEPVAFRNRLEQSPGLGPDALDGSRGRMAVHLHLPGISFRRGFHAGGGNHGDDLSGGCREAQGAPIALDHVQIGGRAAGAGRLVGIQLPNLVVQLARTS